MKARALIFIGCLLLTVPLYPQAPVAQYYPYCAQFEDGTSRDCGFSTLQMCEASVTGVGGLCLNNPAGPPPPQLASGPLHLPDASQAQQPLQAPPPPAQQQPCNPLIDGTYCASANIRQAHNRCRAFKACPAISASAAAIRRRLWVLLRSADPVRPASACSAESLAEDDG